MKVLVANRGEIAVRILRACREMNIASVAVYTDVDETSLHMRYADESVLLGSAKSYLDIAAILQAAHKTGATAIHPGYGFLSENADFAQAVEDQGLIFIGPRAQTIAMLGDKLRARQAAKQAGLPVLPGTDNPLSGKIFLEDLADIPFPMMVKAVAGGGGRGIRIANDVTELQEAINSAQQEAMAAFQDDSIYLESMLENARHIEVQIIGDGQGKVVCLGERECSVQRRRQKIIEEAPAPGLKEELRRKLYTAAVRLGKRLRYRSLGTVEFLLDAQDRFYFIEVNPRIQVEHPVTEMVTGLDLVCDQLNLAAGEPLAYSQSDILMNGAAVEARILAEDTRDGFLPATGLITNLKEPGGPGIRVDSMLYKGLPIGAEYDSLLAKVIAWGRNRDEAIRRLHRALDETQVGGVETDLIFLKQILHSPEFTSAAVTTTFLDQFHPVTDLEDDGLEEEIALAAVFHIQQTAASTANTPTTCVSAWQSAAWREQMNGYS